jgi:hypothetical protein
MVVERERGRTFLLVSVSRQTLRMTENPIQWLSGVYSLGVKGGRDVSLTTHPI